MVLRLHLDSPDFATSFTKLLGLKREVSQEVNDIVQDILADVRTRKDLALFEYTSRFDGFEANANSVTITKDMMDEAENSCDPLQLKALDEAAARIWAYHEKQKPEDILYTDDDGVSLGWRWTAVDAAGLYVPGGLASYPSSVLMNVIPAKVAGVERLVITAPAPARKFNPLVLAAAKRSGVSEAFCVGGAQAIAALAYGTDLIAPVDKIVGPGNAYVAAAKRQVFGTVGIDSIAGPSEILVVADRANDPEWIAADLLSQAEHDPSSQSILICDDEAFADAVGAAAERQIECSPRKEITGAAWTDNSAIIIVSSLENEAPDLVNQLAPEHLELAIENPQAMLPAIRHAGAIFLGRHTPEAIGDYVAGPDHVLPTARAARYASGLSVLDFMKRTSLIGCTPQSVKKIGPAAATLADAEGLPAHAHSVRLRLK